MMLSMRDLLHYSFQLDRNAKGDTSIDMGGCRVHQSK